MARVGARLASKGFLRSVIFSIRQSLAIAPASTSAVSNAFAEQHEQDSKNDKYEAKDDKQEEKDDKLAVKDEVNSYFESYQRKLQKIESLDEIELPSTVKRWKTQSGSRVFLIGTSHCSAQSRDDVSKTIRAVDPDAVMMELCKSRKSLLYEEGTEFQKANEEITLILKRKPCHILFGDRPKDVTFERLSRMVTPSERLRLRMEHRIKNVIVETDFGKSWMDRQIIDPEKAEKTLQKLSETRPINYQVTIYERDVWMANSLLNAESMAMRDAPKLVHKGIAHVVPSVVVGIVEATHQPGIVKAWEKLQDLPLDEVHNLLMELKEIPASLPSSPSPATSCALSIAGLSLFVASCHLALGSVA